MNTRRIARITASLAFCVGASIALAQPAPPPPKLEPLPEIPPPPGVTDDADLAPQVTITRRGGETIEEARVNGQLKWVRVTPAHGRSYYLIPDPSGQGMIRDAHDSGLRVPLWVLFSF